MIMKTELEILMEVKQMFMFHSDYSTQCHGYRSLCDKIAKLESEPTPQPEPVQEGCIYESDNTTAMNCKHCGRPKWHHEYHRLHSQSKPVIDWDENRLKTTILSNYVVQISNTEFWKGVNACYEILKSQLESK
jgi:hypothetical protein